jgi:hypothetical protein
MDTPIKINMKNFLAVAVAVCVVFVLFSCKALPPQRGDLPPAVLGNVPEALPEMPVQSGPPEQIMGKGAVSEKKLAEFLLLVNSRAENDFVRSLAKLYIEEATAEGVNHDVAFAQMCLETGFLRYGNLVKPEWNNFCGLGAIGPEQPGLVFPDPRTGVRAHIQHLKAYATDAPLNQALVDPRYRYVKLGSSPGIHGLSGTWAADRDYSRKIENVLNRLYEFSFR